MGRQRGRHGGTLPQVAQGCQPPTSAPPPTPFRRLQIDVCDIWTHYTPWPCNQLPKSYNFMVKYSILWRLKCAFNFLCVCVYLCVWVGVGMGCLGAREEGARRVQVW